MTVRFDYGFAIGISDPWRSDDRTALCTTTPGDSQVRQQDLRPRDVFMDALKAYVPLEPPCPSLRDRSASQSESRAPTRVPGIRPT